MAGLADEIRGLWDKLPDPYGVTRPGRALPSVPDFVDLSVVQIPGDVDEFAQVGGASAVEKPVVGRGSPSARLRAP